MTVSVSWLKKQMVQFTKVAKAKSGSLWCKPADGEKKHAHCCTLHTHCVFLFCFFYLPMLSILIIHHTEVTWEDQQNMHNGLVHHNGCSPPSGWSCPDWTSASCVYFHLLFFSETLHIQHPKTQLLMYSK